VQATRAVVLSAAHPTDRASRYSRRCIQDRGFRRKAGIVDDFCQQQCFSLVVVIVAITVVAVVPTVRVHIIAGELVQMFLSSPASKTRRKLQGAITYQATLIFWLKHGGILAKQGRLDIIRLAKPVPKEFRDRACVKTLRVLGKCRPRASIRPASHCAIFLYSVGAGF
jgi:hypothetical protein